MLYFFERFFTGFGKKVEGLQQRGKKDPNVRSHPASIHTTPLPDPTTTLFIG